MKILVTGSSGRIGRAVCAAASGRVEWVGLDRVASPTTGIVGDVTDGGLLSRVLAGVAGVVHVAALHAPHVGHVPDAEIRRINVDGTRRLLDACAAHGVGRIVFTSTTAVYGYAATPEGEAGWVTEGLVPEPRTIYHATKLEAETLLTEAARQGGPSVRILRMSRCFPEPANIMAAYRLHRGIDARDVANGHLAALQDDHDDPVDTFILSGETPFEREDVRDLWLEPGRVFERRAPALVASFESRGWRLPQRVDRVYDSSHARRRLGWVPRFGYEDVLYQHDSGSAEVLPAVGL